MSLETTIIHNLILSDQYARKVLPFIKDEYFDTTHKILFQLIQKYFQKYNQVPSPKALEIELSNVDSLNEKTFNEATEVLSNISTAEKLEWLLDNTEKFCQDKAVYNAIMQSIQILDDKTGKASKGSIPDVLSKALAVSFDTHVGHDFLENSEQRFKFYHDKQERIPFDIELLNKITKGGIPRKTLNIIMAGTGVGKSLAMCHMASYNLMRGYNVLYITLEMSEERIAERIDANLLDVAIDQLENIPKEVYDKKIERLVSKSTGKLIIKEYPTASAHSGNFRHLISELKTKKNFVPDIIYIDYINICASSRVKMGSNFNSYMFVKMIAEELRGLAVECDVPIVSATQMNRTGFSDSDAGLESTSESFGLPMTADLFIALIITEELEHLGQILCKQLKNRYSDVAKNRRFVIGYDRSKMRLFDVDQSAQDELVGDVPVFDKSNVGKRMTTEGII